MKYYRDRFDPFVEMLGPTMDRKTHDCDRQFLDAFSCEENGSHLKKKEKNLLSENKQQKSRRYTTKRLLDPHLKQTWRNPYSVKCGKHSFAAVSIS